MKEGVVNGARRRYDSSPSKEQGVPAANLKDPFGARAALDTKGGRAAIYRLDALEKRGVGRVSSLPFSIKVLLENLLRNIDGTLVTEEDAAALAGWNAAAPASREVPFRPARVILQDFTGVPAIVDLAAMRSAMRRLGGDPSCINPLVPVDLVIDHSVQVDFFGSGVALERNAEIEFRRNRERYEFLRWGCKAPYYFLTPKVVGFRLKGRLREGVTATDLVLTVTEILRKQGVVDKFVEFYGPGLSEMPLADRATIGNMSPEYGATMGFFPVDAETLRYLRQTGRSEEEVDRVERYTKEQDLFRTDTIPDPVYTETLELDLASVEPSLAGPKRPQDRVALTALKRSFQLALTAPITERGFGLPAEEAARTVMVGSNGSRAKLGHGSVVIAAITSCTNTSNPTVMIGAGLLAKKALERGMQVPPFVKTSLAPGSKVVTEYLQAAGLLDSLAGIRFNLVGYGCTTCIGNSGPLPPEVAQAVTDSRLVAAAVLSGNRNFEGRIHPQVRANYLASPPLVVAFALAGTVNIDMATEPLGRDSQGSPVYLRDLWPSQQEILETMNRAVRPEMFREIYKNVWDGNPTWNAVPVAGGELYVWRKDSTYIQEPPFFTELERGTEPVSEIRGARVLALLGDSVTTDHISPAGDIAKDSPAGRYLVERGIEKKDFNSYGSRRGNDRVMVRGTFANIRLKNLLVPGTEGGVTLHFPSGNPMPIYDAAMRYKSEGVPLLVIAGREYGAGSSRDWAAKGTLLLGVRAALAESYERIHRSNLVGMGVLPLEFRPGQSAASLGLTGREIFDISGLGDPLQPRATVTATATDPDGEKKTFGAIVRLDSAVEVNYYRNGGILLTVLGGFLKGR
ncbi:MAG: aconitate hydratase AcnA [Acidobacteria bacterium]|nr:MAG: aconitate hydratase AcnA [Acidobacteriota bacterium]